MKACNKENILFHYSYISIAGLVEKPFEERFLKSSFFQYKPLIFMASLQDALESLKTSITIKRHNI